MKRAILGMVLSLCPFFVKAQVNNQRNPDKAPWVYFDLGDTVISTSDMKHLHYFKGAKAYMEDLKKNGFKIGIITNIPETWGMDYDEKLQTLKNVIQTGWDDNEPFDWAVYDDIILPLKNTEMKPAPTMFIKAIDKAFGCPSAFIGESPKEIQAATDAGMAAKLFVANDGELYIPVEKVNRYLKDNYKRVYDPECIN
jgi:phosphoglycolate phosphatase-like HAD superfamily hydrolase